MESTAAAAAAVDDNVGAVAIGAKGTIVSLMEKELQLQGNNRASAPQLQVRNEAVSVYCGNFSASNGGRGNRGSPVDNLKSMSCKHCHSADVKASCKRPAFYSKEALGRSMSLRNARPKEAHKVLHFPSPKSGAPRRKVVSYHDAASSGMMSFVSSSDNESVSRHSQMLPASSVDDHLIPILSPGRQKLPNLSSPAKLSVASSSVQIVDTRCYRGGRELFRPFPKSAASPKKQLNFWRL